MKHQLCAVLTMCMIWIAQPGQAETDQICGNIRQLRDIHKSANASHTISDPTRAIELLAQLSFALSVAPETTVLAQSSSIGARLSLLASRMQGDLEADPANARIRGGRAYDQVTSALRNLTVVVDLLGCDLPPLLDPNQPEIGPTTQPTAQPQGHADSLVSQLSTKISANISYIILLVVVASTLAIGFIIFKMRWREPRKMCRTFMLIEFGDKCTVSHIVEISRGGMQIEVPEEDVGEDWITLSFCGYRIQAKIIWRNAFFAGVKFKKRVDKKVIQDVLDKSLEALENSGLEQNVSSCFSVGCHVNCEKHCPTAILKQ